MAREKTAAKRNSGEKSRFKKVSFDYSEKLSDTEAEVYCAIGGTIVQAKVAVNRVFRGVLGSVRSANNPIIINLTGEENLKGKEFTQQYTVFKYLKAQVLKTMGAEFKELKPEADSFRTLTFSLRVILDEGNHLGAVLLASLSAFYFWATTQQFLLEDGLSSDDWVKSMPFPIICWEPPATSAKAEGQLIMDPTFKEEAVGGSLWIYLISETGQSLFRNGGGTLPSGLSLMTDDGKGKRWRQWVSQGKDAPQSLNL